MFIPKYAFWYKMNYIKHINQINYISSQRIEIDVRIYNEKIKWHYSGRMQFYDGEEDTCEQSYIEYINNGPPEFANGLEPGKISEIDMIVGNIK